MFRIFRDKVKNKFLVITVAAIIAICSIWLIGSGDSPDIIEMEGKKLSYFDNQISPAFFQTGISVKVNDNNEIRCITIRIPSVETYKGICVGDAVEKIEASFNHEIKMGNTYMVLFNGSKEIEPETPDKENDFLWIVYSFDEWNLIERIQIYDFEYGYKMR